MALFKLGQVVATPGALKFCEEHKVNPLLLLGKHSGGDFGDLTQEDVRANVHAIQNDLRILSSYKIGSEKIWVITEADRSSTCVLMPEEY